MSPTGRRTRWLMREPSRTAPSRLFCIPYSGCGASMYRSWPRGTGAVEICPLQPPGRENRIREEAHDTYQSLADDLVDALAPYLDRPFGFFGHCSSALAAYETTVRLARRGLPPPSRLFVSSQVAPQDGPAGSILELDDDGLRERLRTMLGEMGSAPAPDLVELSLEVLRRDVEANRRYVVAEPTWIDVPVTAIGWSDDHEVPATAMSGWAECAPTTFEVLEGDHYAFSEAPAPLRTLVARDLGGAA